MSTILTVATGLYYGFSAAELDLEQARYKAAVKAHTSMRESASGGLAVGLGMNGKTAQYTFPGGLTSFDEWRQELQNAYAQLAGTTEPYTDRAVARFA